MNFAQKMRLIWIDATLASEGNLQRGDIMRAFDVSLPQASNDIRVFRDTWPDAIEYDNRAKWYFRPAGASPAFTECARRWVRGAAYAIGEETIPETAT